jgi:hypothetical protein
MFFFARHIVRAVYRADQRRAANPKTYILPPVIAAVFVLPAIALFTLVPLSDISPLALIVIPVILAGILMAGMKLQDQNTKQVDGQRKAKRDRIAQKVAQMHEAAPAVPQARIARVSALSSQAATTDRPQIAQPQLLARTCPLCFARTGVPCFPLRGQIWVVIGPDVHCHPQRMSQAVRYKDISREAVIDQWGGNLPEGIELWPST